MRIDMFNRSRGERAEFTPRIGVKVETHHFNDLPTAAVIQPAERSMS